MAETLVRFTEAIVGRDGRAYQASACGEPGSDGLWHGWIEFSDGVQSVRTSRESGQPNRDDLMYWAQGLTHVYLEGALDRALRVESESLVVSPPPSIEPNVRHAAVLDPYVVFAQGEDILRGQLLAFSRDQLNAVIEQYDLGPPVPAVRSGPAGYADAVDRIITRIKATISRRVAIAQSWPLPPGIRRVVNESPEATLTRLVSYDFTSRPRCRAFRRTRQHASVRQ